MENDSTKYRYCDILNMFFIYKNEDCDAEAIDKGFLIIQEKRFSFKLLNIDDFGSGYSSLISINRLPFITQDQCLKMNLWNI